ncbi:MAG: HAD hydrolase-like protein [Chloroflexi bacterium]|nr:HAD hydrolase-like protein [Chloroflexota bacterium]
MTFQPQEAIYVGDAEEDVVGANRVGMVSVLIDRHGQGRNYGQKHTVKSLHDILGLV